MRRRRRRRGALVAIAVLAGVLAVAGIGGGAAVFAYGSSCDLDSLRSIEIGENTFVYAADGSLLGSIPAEKNRESVEADEMSIWIRKATIAVEDRRFFAHGGVDVEGIARAAVTDLKAGRIVEGGSTITQQLVRNLYISNERTVQRKLKEACLATKLDRAWTKHRILSTYLNQVYYGNQAYGIEAASQTYFSKPARKLTLTEAALLAGLTQAPSVHNPFTNPRGALARRAEVLRSMRETNVIGPRRFTAAMKSKLRLQPGRLYREIREPYFFGYVRDELIRAYGAEAVRSGGMRVYTTIRPRYQRLAEEAIRDTLTEPTDPASALISISPRTGAIRAMVGVIPNRPKNQFNLVSQARRQPGSTFKTFVLAAAIEMGIDPDSTYYVSAPFTYKQHPAGSCEPDGGWWCVHTYANDYYGWSSIRSATLRSDNAVYAQLTLDVTPDRVARVARKMGVKSQLDRGRCVHSCDGSRLRRGLPARPRLGLRDARRRRCVRGADGDPARRARQRQGRPCGGLGPSKAPPSDLRRNCGSRHTDPRAEHAVGNRHARSLRAFCGREDRNQRGAQGRVVRRLHARPRNDRLDGLHPRRGPDGERARNLGVGRQLPR